MIMSQFTLSCHHGNSKHFIVHLFSSNTTLQHFLCVNFDFHLFLVFTWSTSNTYLTKYWNICNTPCLYITHFPDLFLIKKLEKFFELQQFNSISAYTYYHGDCEVLVQLPAQIYAENGHRKSRVNLYCNMQLDHRLHKMIMCQLILMLERSFTHGSNDCSTHS